MDQRQRKETKNKETDATAIILQSLKKSTEDMSKQRTKVQVKKEKTKTKTTR